MSRSRWVQVISLLVCAACVGGAAWFVPRINEGRRTLNMMGSAKVAENAPPQYAFAIQAMGAFRSLVVNFAFIRFEEFKQKGRSYDAMQMAEWICELQPRFPTVWEFMAWNMSWNYSVQTHTPEERWNWVYSGAKLLRDRGIPNNPRAINLYRALAWTFINKMSEPVDDYAHAYKIYWAYRMHLLFGAPRAEIGTITPEEVQTAIQAAEKSPLDEAARLVYMQNEQKRRDDARARGQEYVPGPAPRDIKLDRDLRSGFEVARAAAVRTMRQVIDAPQRLSDLYAKFPAAAGMVRELRALDVVITDDELSEDSYWARGGLAHTFFRPWREMHEPRQVYADIATDPTKLVKPAEKYAAFDRIVGVTRKDPAGDALFQHLRAKVLRQVYRMDPATMLLLIEEFGPMDWRCVDAIGLYWSWAGYVASGETAIDMRNDKTNSFRLIFFALRNLWRRNSLTLEANPDNLPASYLSVMADVDFVQPLLIAFERYAPLVDPSDTRDIFRTGHINFLNEALRTLWWQGREQQAAELYEYLRSRYPTDDLGRPNPAFERTLSRYVLIGHYEGLEQVSLHEATIFMSALLRGMFDAFAEGDAQRGARIRGNAMQLHADYMAERKRMGHPPGKNEFPPFADMETDILRLFLVNPAGTGPEVLSKVRVWAGALLNWRQAVYDDVLPVLTAECEAFGYDVAKAFPEPDGMEDHRKRFPKKGTPVGGQDGGANTPQRGPG